MHAQPRKLFEKQPTTLEEALEQEEIANQTVSKEIVHFYEKNRGHVTLATSYVKSLVFGPEKGEADTKEVDAIVEYIVGPPGKWRNEGSEVSEFLRTIDQSYVDEWSLFHSVNPQVPEHVAMRSLPPTYLLPPLETAQLEMLSCKTSTKPSGMAFGTVLMRIWYVDSAGCSCSTLREFTFGTVADKAIATTMSRVLVLTEANKTQRNTVFVFRAKGRKEYIYGNEQLINYRYIRDCVRKQKEISVAVETKDEALLLSPVFRPSYVSQALPNRRHVELAKRTGPPDISLWSMDEKLRVRVVGGFERLTISNERVKEEGLRDKDDLYLAVLVELYFGTARCCEPQITSWRQLSQFVSTAQSRPTSATVGWQGDGDVVFSLNLSDAPRETKVCCSLLASPGDRFNVVKHRDASGIIAAAEQNSKKGEEQSRAVIFLGEASTQLFDSQARLRTGPQLMHLRDSKARANPIGFTTRSPDNNTCTFWLELPTYPKPVVIASGRPPACKEESARTASSEKEARLKKSLLNNEVEQLRHLKRIIFADPLYELTFDDTVILWKYREILVCEPKAMAKFLQAVDWTQPFDVYEAHCMIRRWSLLTPFDALELLDARFADTAVRELAVRRLESMSDHELRSCILQLVQVLKYEPYHYSALSRFLLQRSFKSNHVIGHYVFWYLVAEVENPSICERHGLLLEQFLKRSPLRRNYLRQVYVSRELLQCALKVGGVQKKDRLRSLQESLASAQFPPHFTLPLDPAVECSGVEISKCKVMDSKKFPIWLAFKNYLDPDDRYFLIFKSGDDLRQDVLTLQLLGLMDAAWKASGMDLHIIPYACISTGEGVGMIEVVLNSDTIANITRKEGGAQAAFSEEPLINYLRKFNTDRTEVETCLWNFLYSVAGYSVATYILGIGDRHNDNIMLRQDGTLFHIDFGHFLGNFKTKFGIKRETAPFVFTPMHLYVMGGGDSPIFDYFVEVACEAYNVIRRCSYAFILFFMLMLSTGIPELQTKEDIRWLRNVLLLNRSDEEAREHYKGLVNAAASNVRSVINDYIHIMAH